MLHPPPADCRPTFELDSDLEPYLVAVTINPSAKFKSFQVDPDLETVVWENGADLAPEFLYGNGKTDVIPFTPPVTHSVCGNSI